MFIRPAQRPSRARRPSATRNNACVSRDERRVRLIPGPLYSEQPRTNVTPVRKANGRKIRFVGLCERSDLTRARARRKTFKIWSLKRPKTYVLITTAVRFEHWRLKPKSFRIYRNNSASVIYIYIFVRVVGAMGPLGVCLVFRKFLRSFLVIKNR